MITPQIPESFEAGGRIWDVEIVPVGTLQDYDGNPAYGITDFESATIRLEAVDSPRLFYQTWFHELGHALYYSIGIFDQEADEIHRAIDALGSSLLSMHMSAKGRHRP